MESLALIPGRILTKARFQERSEPARVDDSMRKKIMSIYKRSLSASPAVSIGRLKSTA